VHVQNDYLNSESQVRVVEVKVGEEKNKGVRKVGTKGGVKGFP